MLAAGSPSSQAFGGPVVTVCLKQASLQSLLCPYWSPCSSFHRSPALLTAAQTPNHSWSSPASLPVARRFPSLLPLHRMQRCPCWARCHSVLALLLCLPMSPVSLLVPLCAWRLGPWCLCLLLVHSASKREQ